MLSQFEKDKFRLALASFNNDSILNIEDLDISDMIEDYQVAVTTDTLDDFFDKQGRQLNRRTGDRPSIPYELNKTLLGDVYKWENVQSRKGCRRGTLYVMDMGDFRACYFDGEV